LCRGNPVRDYVAIPHNLCRGNPTKDYVEKPVDLCGGNPVKDFVDTLVIFAEETLVKTMLKSP